MTLFQVVARELRVSARRPLTHWLRCLVGLALVLLWALLVWADKFTPPASLGHDIFMAMSILILGLCLFSGVFLTADCLSEEKREGTLGLLFLTTLKSHDVVLGKLAARSLQSLFAVLAVFPVLALPLLMGGVTGVEFMNVLVVLLVSALFSLAIGLLVSSVSYDARQAIGRTLLILIVFAGVGPVLWWIQHIVYSGPEGDFLLWGSPGFALAKAFQPAALRAPADLVRSVSVITGLALASGLGACFKLHQAVRADLLSLPVETAAKPSVVEKARLDSINPFEWLCARHRKFNRHWWRILAVAGPLWFILIWMMTTGAGGGAVRDIASMIATALLFGFHQLLKIFAAIEATRRLNEDRQSGALELLLVSPLPVESILRGCYRATRAKFIGPIASLSAMNLIYVATIIRFAKELHMDDEEGVLVCSISIGAIWLLTVDFRALVWFGMRRALVAKRHPRAILSTLLPIMAPFWFCIFLLFTGVGERLGSFREIATVIAIWFAVAVVVDAIIANRAREALRTRFRELAWEK